MEKKDIRTLGEDELSTAIISDGEQPYRARQIYQWIWAKSALDFDDMTNLSKPLRDALKKNYEFRPVRIDLVQQSSDQTVKLAFRLFDDHIIEGVLIPSVDRMTACVSSQAGCSLSCKFCATGYLERQRNLTPGEIYDQVIHIRNISLKYFEKPLTNISRICF